MSESSTTLPLVRQGEPSRTALAVAQLRAVHALLDEPPVFLDPLALPVLGAAAEAALRDDPFALNDPFSRGLRGALVARSRFVEDELARRVEAGVRQYVVLGAGLDTFGCRHPAGAGGLRVFEVDHPGTQGWKQQRLAEAGIAVPAALSFVPFDFEADDLGRALRQAGFDADRPACVGWMGVTMYLSVEAVESTLALLAGLAPGSCLCFDHRVPPQMLDPVERAIHDRMAQRMAALGEPWRSSFDPDALRQRLLARGFRHVDSVTPAQLDQRYFARRKDGLRCGGGLRLVCAET